VKFFAEKMQNRTLAAGKKSGKKYAAKPRKNWNLTIKKQLKTAKSV
jgi:hypothetical protein